MNRLAGKIALITGAASGIGYTTAERFIAEGATVILADRAEEMLAAAYASVCGAAAPHRAVRLDVTLEDAWMGAIAEIDAAYGRLDVLVNNAGSGVARSIETTPLAMNRAS